MKNIIPFLLFFLLGISCFAQLTCDEGRYQDSIFDVSVTPDILYGNNLNYAGASTNLYLDIYEPAGDMLDARPLIIFAAKGSFLQMNRKETSMVQLCTRFAEMGYVTASIDYRTGVDYMATYLDPDGEFTKAVLRASHDYKAAIRFFRKDAYTDNIYRIDTNTIIAGGSSAGAITALHVVYLDKIEEIPAGFDTTGLGGQEGYSGNPGYSSKAHYVVNLCGAIADTSWIEPGDVPLVSMHGNLDTEVPYGTAVISMGIPIMEVSGSKSINERCQNVGVENSFYTFWGQYHIPYDENAGGPYLQYMDTVVNYVRDFLAPKMCNWIVSTEAKELNTNGLLAYPNPAKDKVNLTINSKSSGKSKVEFYSLTGILVYSDWVSAGVQNVTVDLDGFKSGTYLIKITNEEYVEIQKILVL